MEVKAFAVWMRASSSSLRDQGHVGQADLIDGVAAPGGRLAADLAVSCVDDLLEADLASRNGQAGVSFIPGPRTVMKLLQLAGVMEGLNWWRSAPE